MTKFVLVDGSAYLFRAYHALPPLITTKGIPTGAIYGVVSMLRKLLADEKPDFIAVIFDTKAKNFRHEIYPEYKANRTEMPDELGTQIPLLHEIIRAMGLPLLAIEGVEADDVIGTLARKATALKFQTIISTSDKDLAQLVNNHVTLINTMTGNILDEKGVMTKFGVKPGQIIDYLTLIGDPVDNVPGIPKVGPKTAAKWLADYQTLENILQHANEIKGKVGENLREFADKLPLGKQLVTVKCDMPIKETPEALTLQPKDHERLKGLFQELEFKTWLKEYAIDEAQIARDKKFSEKGSYEIILGENQLLVWLDRIKKSKQCVINLYPPNADPMQTDLVGISLSSEIGKAAYVPLGHQYIGCPLQLTKCWVLEKLQPILIDPNIKKIGFNIKYAMHLLARCDIELQNNADDPMLQSYVVNSVAARHDKESLAQHYLQYKTLTYDELVGKGVKQIPFAQVEIKQATDYAAEDADITLRLHKTLAESDPLSSVYREIEMPLVPVLWQMEENGICIDAKKLQKQSEQIAKTLTELEERATILAGEQFNLSSPKQLQEILYQKLQLPILERTPTGAPSTGESVLQELSEEYELARVILTHRGLSKLKTTYTDKLPQQMNPKTGRIHTSYHQAVTATGRLSSSDPNLQNIPIRTEEGRKIRQAFIPEKGSLIVSADYSQIELRIMAHLSQDKGLLTAFQQGEDIHRFTASEIFAVPLSEVTNEQRRAAKAINFGLIYGMSAFGVSKQLGIDRQSAQAYMDLYFQRYPGVKQYMDNTRRIAAEKGYVETLFGRRLYLPEIRSKNVGRKRAAERTAINAPMQGTAADIIKKAMIVLHQHLKQETAIKMLMQVHDELVFEVKESALEKAKILIVDCMQNTVKLSVPLVVSIGAGKNWDEAH